jgi:hypothetical protein
MRLDSCKPLSLSVLVTAEVLALAVIGKSEAMRTHHLVRTLPTPIYTRTVKGTDAEKSGTKGDYEKRWKHFHAFCVLVGKYTCSLVLDRDGCPDSPIPVQTDTIRLYLSYMTFSPGDQLVHPDTKVVVRDVLGNPVFCTGAWLAPGNLTKFRSAMLGLDTLHVELTGPYLEKCNECTSRTIRSSSGRSSRGTNVLVTHSPCSLHTDGARVRSKGCVMDAPKTKREVAYRT